MTDPKSMEVLHELPPTAPDKYREMYDRVSALKPGEVLKASFENKYEAYLASSSVSSFFRRRGVKLRSSKRDLDLFIWKE